MKNTKTAMAQLGIIIADMTIEIAKLKEQFENNISPERMDTAEGVVVGMHQKLNKCQTRIEQLEIELSKTKKLLARERETTETLRTTIDQYKTTNNEKTPF